MPRFEAGEIVRPTRSAFGDVDLIGVVTDVLPHGGGIESLAVSVNKFETPAFGISR